MFKRIIFLAFIFIYFSSTGYAAGSYKRYNLPHGISVEIPSGWELLDKNTSRQLDNSTEAITGINQSSNEILLAANCYTNRKNPSATFRISYRGTQQLTQEDLKNFTKTDLEELKKQAWAQSEKLNNSKHSKIDLYSLQVGLEKISNMMAIATFKIDYYNGYPEYHMFYIIPVKNSIIKIYATCTRGEKYFVNILDKIITSITISS